MKRAARKCEKAWKWSVATVPPREYIVLLRASRWAEVKQLENKTWGFCLHTATTGKLSHLVARMSCSSEVTLLLAAELH